MEYHVPAMADEVVEGLVRGDGGTYVDATAGGGGHSAALLAAGSGARLVAVDRDPEAIAAASRRLASFGERVRLVQGEFAHLAELVRPVLEEWGPGAVDGVLFDLGVSSHQLDEAGRGFSFRQEGQLDMRMDRGAGAPAADLLARVDEADLVQLIRELGEERGARRIARAICRARDRDGMATTAQLREAVEGTRPERPDKSLARVFQALRIRVNDELGQLEAGLEEAIELLGPGGRLAVISYHSLEDRRVKVRLGELVRGCVCPPRAPVCGCGRRPTFKAVWRKARRPDASEVESNPRARSARLRLYEKL
ncbi:MAG: 16S rRNA (cytosine(1402)-N(4))-methyltransferase RsmH [Gemmatimonadota bacterium]